MRKRVLKCAGAEVAFLIGSGFASGQEILQFFAVYGPGYGLLGGLITMALLVWISVRVMTDARTLHLENVNRIFRFYCGRHLGLLFEWMTPLFLFGIYVVMISGAGALLWESWGVPQNVGRLLMMLFSLGTVLLGLERLTGIVGTVGPVMILLVAAVGIACILKSPGKILAAAMLVRRLPIARATETWWLSGITYATFNGFTLMPFLAGLGGQLQSGRESRSAGAAGASAFAVTAILLQYGMLACLESIYNKEVPTIHMADFLWPGAGCAFSVIMLAGIYTTAVPALWSACTRLAGGERSRRFRVSAAVLVLAAGLCGDLPFTKLVNLVYPYIGYCGIAVFLCVLFHDLRYRVFPEICGNKRKKYPQKLPKRKDASPKGRIL